MESNLIVNMSLIQEIKFHLQLNLSESYIYGKATMDGKHYSINIQQAKNQLIVLPIDFSYIGEPINALISFSKHDHNNDKKIRMTSEIHIGQGDLIEVYLDQDDMLLSIAKDLPVEITIQMISTYPVNNEGR
jgi:hypothetical protein